MPQPFAQTLRSLREDRTFARTTLLAAAAVVLVPWGFWGVHGEVTLREVSASARVEVDLATTTVGAPREGRVLAVRAVLGSEVAEGDVLVELDPAPVRHELDAARARVASVPPRIEAIRREIDAETAADRRSVTATAKAVEEARARAAEAKTQSDLADHQASLSESLVGQGAVSREQAREARSKADAAAARVRSIEVEAERIATDADVERADRATRIAKLEREIADLDAAQATGRADVSRLEADLALFVVRAPIAGRVGEVAPIRAGSVVEFADRLCVLVPGGTPRVVAAFPVRAAGRLRAGQPARLRFDGFPWTRFGTVDARVSALGTPEADGTFRCELALAPGGASAIPVAHGLSCTAEVEVERVSPLELALRSAGRLLDGSRDDVPGPAGGAPR